MPKSDLSDAGHDSNPPLSAKIWRNQTENVENKTFENLVWQYPVAERMISYTEKTQRHPYKQCRLVHHNHNLKKRWYVIFYAWDVRTEKLTRKRLFEPINREKTVWKRLEVAEDVIRMVNAKLEAGKVLGTKRPLANNTRHNVLKLSLLQAIDYVKDQKEQTNHSPYYIKAFARLKGNIERWMEYDQRDDFLAKNFDQDDAYSFFQYLNQVRKVANKTYNNYRTDLATVFNFLMKRNPNLMKVNPVMILDKLPVTNRKHAALSDDQMDKIKKACIEKGYTSLLLFIQIIYYTFGRPREIVRLKIENFDLENNRVFFPAAISKSRMDDYVGLSPALRKVLVAIDLKNYPPGYYLFGPKDNPGVKHMGYLYFYNRNKAIFKALGLDQVSVRHSLYSYKHSGVISLYKATKDIKLVQSQCRHHNSLDQTNKYLRDLGLLSDYDGLKDWNGGI